MNKMHIIITVSVISISQASAQVYKWTDANGKIHYGDMPTTSRVKKVDTRPTMKGTESPKAVNSNAAGSGGAAAKSRPQASGGTWHCGQ